MKIKVEHVPFRYYEKPKGDHFCVECGRKSNDWLVEVGIISVDKSWCGDCSQRFGQKLHEKMLEQPERLLKIFQLMADCYGNKKEN